MAASSDLGRYLDLVVALTRYRDPQELGSALLKTLQKLMPGSKGRLLAIANENRDTEFNETNISNAIVYDLLDDAASEPVFLYVDADLLECVKTQMPIYRERNGATRLVFPVLGANYTWALLVIDGLRDDVVPIELLGKLLQVYSNQTYILSRSQLDPLTGLYNRQSFYERIRRLVQRSPQRRAGDTTITRGHCFALLDVDFFKEVNDRYGHLYGDEVLLLLARLMTRSFRHEDLLFRYGGEEFAAVLINVDLDGAERMLERFRTAVANYAFPRLEPKTVSIGFTALTTETDIDRVVMRADKALYYAKHNGRNVVCCYEKLIAEKKLEPVTVAEGDIELF